MKIRSSALAASLALSAGIARAQVPEYRVEPIMPITTTTTLTGASDAGHVVGWQVMTGIVRGFVIDPSGSHVLLPLPAGYLSSAAFDVNNHGVVVGAVGGEPAIWTPDGQGGYDVTIPQQFSSLPSPLGGSLAIEGGQAVAINDAGQIVGWSQFQGFQGGPATLFSPAAAPVDLRALGLNATPRDISESGVVVGGDLRFDLATSAVTHLGLPPDLPGNTSFVSVIAFAVNDSGTSVVAARLATSLPDQWLTYIHSDATGYEPLAPGALPYVFLFPDDYSINERGDVVARGGVLFADEDVRVPGLGGLLEPGSSHWNVGLGRIDVDRRIIARADSGGQSAIVRLIPTSVGTAVCGPAAPSSAGLTGEIRAEGSAWILSNDLRLHAEQLPTSTLAMFVSSMTLAAAPVVPAGSQGRLCLGGSIGRYSGALLDSGSQGAVELAIDLTAMPTPFALVAGQPGDTWYFQTWFRDVTGGGAQTSNFTDALSVTLR